MEPALRQEFWSAEHSRTCMALRRPVARDNGGEQTGGDLVMDRNLNIYGATNNAGANATGSV